MKNPKGNERKYRPGIMKVGMVGSGNKSTDKQTSSEEVEDEKDKLVRMEQDNQVWHQFLSEVRPFFFPHLPGDNSFTAPLCLENVRALRSDSAAQREWRRRAIGSSRIWYASSNSCCTSVHPHGVDIIVLFSDSTSKSSFVPPEFRDPFGGVYIGPIEDELVTERKLSNISVVFSSPTQSVVVPPGVEDVTEKTSLLP